MTGRVVQLNTWTPGHDVPGCCAVGPLQCCGMNDTDGAVESLHLVKAATRQPRNTSKQERTPPARVPDRDRRRVLRRAAGDRGPDSGERPQQAWAGPARAASASAGDKAARRLLPCLRLCSVPGRAGRDSPSGRARKDASCRSRGHSRAASGSGNAGPLPRYDHAKRPGPDDAADRGGQHDRLAVDTDRDLGSIGVHGDFPGGEGSQSRAVPTADESGGLPGVVHPDGDHAQRAGVQPGAPGPGRPCRSSRTGRC